MNPGELDLIIFAIPTWIIVMAVGLISFLNSAAVTVYAERKVAAFIQNRIGPNRVGPFGALQRGRKEFYSPQQMHK